MAKLFRFSGYLLECTDCESENGVKIRFEDMLLCDDGDIFQQLHVEESEEFELDGEDKENCDLALLTRHFKVYNSKPSKFNRAFPTKGQKYRHFKLGKIVTVIGISRHTETEEVTVVYEYEGTIWNRPLEMFMSEVDREKYPDAEQKYRFELVEGEEKKTECKNCEYMIESDYGKSCTNNYIKSLLWHGEKPFDENKPCPYYEPKKNRKERDSYETY